MLHLTSAYAPEGTLAEAAAVLEPRARRRTGGVFGDFAAAAEVAGRPAVTYREVRPGRVVTWAVVLAGSTRIGIGCQSPPGREQSLVRRLPRRIAPLVTPRNRWNRIGARMRPN